MNYELPNIINTYINALNSQKEQVFINCLTDDAYVYDAGREILGIEAIQHWITSEAFAYNVHMELDSAKRHYSEYILTLKMSGTYDKKLAPDPTYMDYHFTLSDNKICKLFIVLNKAKSIR